MLNKQGPGKIDWTDYTWNPISGKCNHGCLYCYMHGFWRRYPEMAKLQFKEKYLLDKMPKKPSKIFVGSSTDMWGDWVHGELIEEVLYKVHQHKQHTFQFLTKNPKRYDDFDLSLLDNCWFGTSEDGTFKTLENHKLLVDRIPKDITKFVSFEPLIESPMISFNEFAELDWIIIGADSSKGAKKPLKLWADFLIHKARELNIPVWIKDNYGYPETIKEFPLSKSNLQ